VRIYITPATRHATFLAQTESLFKNENMKGVLIFALALSGGIAVAQDAQNEEVHRVRHFNKIVASPRINVVLQKGDQESVRLVCTNVSPEMVNVEVFGKKLRIYLDRARIVEKYQRMSGRHHHVHYESMYHGASVTAYVTYRELKDIEVRGNQELTCNDEIDVDKLKVRAYGETDIRLAKVNTGKFKVSLYGENSFKIVSGRAGHQVYRLFGENRIDTRGLTSESASTRIYGEGRLKLAVSHEVVVNAIGEPEIVVEGSPNINRGIVIGRAEISRQ